jgi:hypothetical protein
MLNPSQVLLQGFTVNIRQWIAGLCGNSITKESLITVGIGTVSYLLAIPFEEGSICKSIFNACSQSMYINAIIGCVNPVIDDSQEWISNKLDYYGYDEYTEYVDPLLDITAALALRQMSGLALELNIPSTVSTAMPSDSPSVAQTSQSILGRISNGFNIGKVSQANTPNIASQPLDFTADFMFLRGIGKLITSIATSIYQSFSDNKSELSVYDIKNILKAEIPAEEYNRAAVKAKAEQIIAKIQQADNYYEKFESKPDIQKKIDIVTNLYLKNIGIQLKMQYASILADNPKLIEKSELLVEKSMKMQVIDRLMKAQTMSAELKEIKKLNILPEAKIIKQQAYIQLNLDLKQFSDATAEEQAHYKNLFSKAAMIEAEYEWILDMLQDNLQNELTQMEPHAEIAI